MRLAILAALALTVLGFALTDRASACSCATAPAEERYREADAAVIGTVISDDGEVGRIRVEHDFKVELGDVVEVPTEGESASCGLDLSEGAYVGLLLRRHDDGWIAGTCDVIDPDELPGAQERLPKPLGAGTAVLLAYGSFSAGRLAALDAEGRPLAYGPGPGRTYAVSVCPGSQYAVELVGASGRVLAVRRLRDMAVIERRTPWRRGLSAVACRDPEGRSIVASVRGRDGRIVTLERGRPRTVHRGRFFAVELLGRFAFLGDRRGMSLLDVDTGEVRRLRGVRRHTEAWALSPDGTRAAGIAPGFDTREEGCGVAVVDLRRPRPATTRRLPGSFFEGTVIWLSADRLLLGGGGTPLRLFDASLRPVRTYRSRPEAVLLTFAGGGIYGRGDDGRLQVARPPDFAVRDLVRLPAGGLTDLAGIPGGTEIRTAG